MSVKLVQKRLSLTFHVWQPKRQQPRHNTVRWCDLSMTFHGSRSNSPVAALRARVTLA